MAKKVGTSGPFVGRDERGETIQTVEVANKSKKGIAMQHNSITASSQERALIEKIRMLSPDKFVEVQDFVDFLSQKRRDTHLLQASNKLAQDAFNKVWDNPEDAEYDNL